MQFINSTFVVYITYFSNKKFILGSTGSNAAADFFFIVVAIIIAFYYASSIMLTTHTFSNPKASFI
jgi:hypothetical protein